MNADKNVEAVGCDASIMKNVWEIREREYEQKIKMEENRIAQSALTSINQNWANRFLSKQPNYKRSEKKSKTVEPPADENVWKSKPQPRVPAPAPPPASRGSGSAPASRPGIQSRPVSTPALKKDQDKVMTKLQLLTYITKTQPPAMVWGRESWKYNKCVPLPPQGAESVKDWGQCWRLATQQPFSEPGNPWPNGPNMMDPQSLYLWQKQDYRLVESKDLEKNLCNEDWGMSWKKPKDGKEKESTQGRWGLFAALVESQHHNEVQRSSEWNDSWQSTKPGNQEHVSVSPQEVSHPNTQESCENMSPEWDECWKMTNHHGPGNTRITQGRKLDVPQWASSWRSAVRTPNNQNKSDPSMKNDEIMCNDRNPQQKFIIVHRELKPRKIYSDHDKFQTSLEWNKSWQVTKITSKPSAEIEKVLKAPPPKTEAPVKVEQKPKMQRTEQASPYHKLKQEVIFHPRREISHWMLLRLRHLEKASSGSEWKDSWKMLKHQMRMDRRRMRPDPPRPFGSSEKEQKMKPSEWKDSWKFTNLPLRQDDQAWQQPWLSTPWVRVNRVTQVNHFPHVDFQRNGPTGERSWAQSWRFSRRQHMSEPGQGGARGATSRHPDDLHHDHRWYEHPEEPNQEQQRRGYNRPTQGWNEAWMFSETEYRHDTTPWYQWMEAWRFSIFHTQQMLGNKYIDEIFEIQPHRENIPLERAKARMSRSFDKQIFSERFPEKVWNESWKDKPLLSQNLNKAPGGERRSFKSPVSDECGCKWGRSFRIANPMPEEGQRWVQTPPSPCYYDVMWWKNKKIQYNIDSRFTNNTKVCKQWETSAMVLQSFIPRIKDTSSLKGSNDPCVVVFKTVRSKKPLYRTMVKENQARSAQSDKKWAGCHSLGKTQPRPKKRAAPGKKGKMEEECDERWTEEWVESWRFVFRPQILKKQMNKLLMGWTESWKMLIPSYPSQSPAKAK